MASGKQILADFTRETGFARKLVGINIVSADPGRLAAFYRDVLGADVCEEHGGPQRIELWFGPRDERTVWITVNHDPAFVPRTYQACQGLEFRVADVDAEYARIRALGVPVAAPPADLPWGFRFFHVADPDGNGIDLVQKL